MRLILNCQAGISSWLMRISGTPKMEFIFTDPETMLYASGMILMLTSESSSREMMFSSYLWSLDSTAMMTSSIFFSLIMAGRSA
jgi:hypothetical protein